jgi:hypothetical protein
MAQSSVTPIDSSLRLIPSFHSQLTPKGATYQLKALDSWSSLIPAPFKFKLEHHIAIHLFLLAIMESTNTEEG